MKDGGAECPGCCFFGLSTRRHKEYFFGRRGGGVWGVGRAVCVCVLWHLRPLISPWAGPALMKYMETGFKADFTSTATPPPPILEEFLSKCARVLRCMYF